MRFSDVDLVQAATPGETMILNFRHPLEAQKVCGKLRDTANRNFKLKGIRLGPSTIVNTTINRAASSTRCAPRERDPMMHQTRNCNHWHPGIKVYIGVDSRKGAGHAVCSKTASLADKYMLDNLPHGEKRKVLDDDANLDHRVPIY